jgi:hypothetical protein
MKVYILTAFPAPPIDRLNFAHLWLKESYQEDPFGKHVLCEDPKEADIILFVEAHPGHDTYLLSVLRHPIYRRYPKKCFLYHDNDFALPIIRGIYPSILKQDYQQDLCRSFGYIARMAPNPYCQYKPSQGSRPRWLYSFVGERNAKVRADIFSQSHPDGLIQETSGKRHWAMPLGPERDAFMHAYAESIKHSAFVLCPRGFGPATHRLFETMEMGRAPVILSDQWVPPQGPRWERFSLQLRESQANQIGTILREHTSRYEEMGREARLAWEEYFSKPVCFHRIVELCFELQITPLRTSSQFYALSKLFRPDRLKMQLRPFIKGVLLKKIALARTHSSDAKRPKDS